MVSWQKEFFIGSESFLVKKLEWNKAVRDFVSSNHYTNSVPASVKYAFGLISGNELIGVATFGGFANPQSFHKYKGHLELSRLFILDVTPKNTESAFISRCLSMLRSNTDYLGVISYASPSEGHQGTIYKAANFSLIGKTQKSYYYKKPDGSRGYKRATWRRAKENGVSESDQAALDGLIKVEEEPKLIFKYKLRDGLGHVFKYKPAKTFVRSDDWDESIHCALSVQESVVLLDKEDLPLFESRKWFVRNGYLTTTSSFKRYETFHRLVMNSPAGLIVDHKNRNRLDNRKCNLRIASSSQNQANAVRKSKHGRGIKFRNGKYEASITVDGKREYLGRFESVDAAKRAYDERAVKIFGEFAVTNFRIENYEIPEKPEHVPSPKEIVRNNYKRSCVICERDAMGSSSLCKNCHSAERRSGRSLIENSCSSRVAFTKSHCISDGCKGKVFSRNLCAKHYSDVRKSEGYRKPRKKYRCSVDGCEIPAFKIADRICMKHFKERTGIRKDTPFGKKKCAVESCKSIACKAGGYCYRHRGLYIKPVKSRRMGVFLREIRTGIGKTLKEVSSVLGYKTDSTLSLIESGDRPLSYENAIKICNFFSIDQEDFFSRFFNDSNRL